MHSPTGFASDGGFPLQMQYLSELFSSTVLVLPVSRRATPDGEMVLNGKSLRVCPLSQLQSENARRKLIFPFWLLRNAPRIVGAFVNSDAVHAPIPSDLGMVAMLLAIIAKKKLLVRYGGNWFEQKTLFEKIGRKIMERFGGGRYIMFATGWSNMPPSSMNRSIHWIFSTTFTAAEVEAYGRQRGICGSRKLRVITVGRQDGHKGTGLIVAGLNDLVKEGVDLHLDVVGDGPDLPRLKMIAAETNVEQQVAFHGKLNHSEVMSLLSECDLFCLLSESEGFPKSLVEAFCCGLPAITSSVSILRELVHKRAGLTISNREKKSIVLAITRIFGDRDAYRAYSKNALSMAKKFTVENWMREINKKMCLHWNTCRE